MKTGKIFLVAAIALLTTSSDSLGQSPRIQPMPLAESVNAPAYTMPYTTVNVRLVVEKTTVVSGPYARYAQKFLGVSAPLADSEVCELVSAELDYTDPQHQGFPDRAAAPRSHAPRPVSHTSSNTGFTRVAPDRTSITDKSTEDMARDAANAIYTLRKRRYDLVSGEAGENVYGQGMRAALQEMDRIENEYLAMFMGKRSTERIVTYHDVLPAEGKNTYVVCRFSDTQGAVSELDLSGRPITVTLTSENTLDDMARGSKGTYYRVAEIVKCRILDGSRELASKTIPVYQFGKTIAVQAR